MTTTWTYEMAVLAQEIQADASLHPEHRARAQHWIDEHPEAYGPDGSANAPDDDYRAKDNIPF